MVGDNGQTDGDGDGDDDGDKDHGKVIQIIQR